MKTIEENINIVSFLLYLIQRGLGQPFPTRRGLEQGGGSNRRTHKRGEANQRGKLAK